MKLHMNFPIWVWLYDYGSLNHPEIWRFGDENPRLTYPQAHTYAFLTEEEALEHAKRVWSSNHKYVLQKTYLQIEKE